jgi:hypothetical protein
VNRLLFDGGRVSVCEQGRVGADSGPEAGQLARKVEPPSWIARKMTTSIPPNNQALRSILPKVPEGGKGTRPLGSVAE